MKCKSEQIKMHGFSHFFHRQRSRESTPPSNREESCSESWGSALSSTDSRASGASGVSDHNENTPSRAIDISQSSSGTHRSQRNSPLEFASSPRDRYPNFASYYREYMEIANVYQSVSPENRTHRRSEEERHQSHANAGRRSSHDHRHFVSPLYDDVMDETPENEYSKVEKYGEISSSTKSHSPHRSRSDNKSFVQKLTESFSHNRDQPQCSSSQSRRSSGSSAGGARHKHSIQDLIKTFSKKVGHWRHDSGEGRRGSCADSAASPSAVQKEKFRSRSKSLDAGHSHKESKRAALEDCGATYQIYESILQEGNFSFFCN